jgi:hypothetical protein
MAVPFEIFYKGVLQDIDFLPITGTNEYMIVGIPKGGGSKSTIIKYATKDLNNLTGPIVMLGTSSAGDELEEALRVNFMIGTYVNPPGWEIITIGNQKFRTYPEGLAYPI